MNAEDRRRAARIGREVERAILGLGPSQKLLLTVETDRRGHVRWPPRKELRICGPLTEAGGVGSESALGGHDEP